MAPSVVLVHGAWHGPWCWDRVRAGLDARGITCATVDLPTGASGGRAGLADDVAAVRRTLDDLEAVVLVGHSYGGAAVTGAGLHSAVRRLVYLASFPLDDGESCSAAAGAEAEAAGISHDGRFEPEFVMNDDGTFVPTPQSAATMFYNDCGADTVAWAVSQLRPQPMAALAESVGDIAWREKPSSYAICSDDNAVHPDLQRILATRCTDSVEWPTSHSPFLSRPELVVDYIAAATH